MLNKLIDYIHHPEQMNTDSLAFLEDVLHRYPYHQTAWMLYLQNLQVVGDARYDECLSKAALSVNNRRILYYLVQEAHEASLARKSAQVELVEDVVVSDASPVAEVDATAHVEAVDSVAADAPRAIHIPFTSASSTDVPSSEVPSSEVPSSEVPSSEVPSSEVPSSEVPSSEVPSVESSSTFEPSPITSSQTSSSGVSLQASPNVDDASAEVSSAESPSSLEGEEQKEMEKSQVVQITAGDETPHTDSSASSASVVVGPRVVETSVDPSVVVVEGPKVIESEPSSVEAAPTVAASVPADDNAKAMSTSSAEPTSSADDEEEEDEEEWYEEAPIASVQMPEQAPAAATQTSAAAPMPSTIEATTDYISYLSKCEDVPMQQVPKLKGQDLIDNFLNGQDGEERITLNPTGGKYTPRNEPELNMEADDGVFTETLAAIYIKQGRYLKAIEIIRKLCLKYPKKNRYFADQIRYLEKMVLINKSSK